MLDVVLLLTTIVLSIIKDVMSEKNRARLTKGESSLLLNCQSERLPLMSG